LIHAAVCIALILIVLLQKGKGASMGVAFGGGASQTVFGASGATSFLQKVTTAIAILFMFTSLGLSFFKGRAPSSSIMEGVQQTQQLPAAGQSETPAQSESAPGQQ
jgi:preprotein translocase subunit SecG